MSAEGFSLEKGEPLEEKTDDLYDEMGSNRRALILGAGKLDIDGVIDFWQDYDHVVYVDRSYVETATIAEIEHGFMTEETSISFYSGDIFEFLDTFKFMFNIVIAERIFEHMFYDSGEIGRLLDACNQVTTDDGDLTIVVPNANTLSRILQNIDQGKSTNQGGDLLIVNTEFCNTRCDPHGSVWTPELAKIYIEQKEGGTWKIESIQEIHEHKGRSVYMQIYCKKPQSAIN